MTIKRFGLGAAHLFILLAAVVMMALPVPRAAWAEDDEEITCPEKRKDTTFLFAHGLHGHPWEWDTFAKSVKKQGFNVWRTKVKSAGHIHERAEQLADFMKKAQRKCDTPDKTVIAVGHSMGGLDIRYIVGRAADYHRKGDGKSGSKALYERAKLLKKVYTIATPHLGDPNACLAQGGIHDLCGHPDDPEKDSPMRDFNRNYKYSDFKNLDIRFWAFYYECKNIKEGEDGVVPVKSQKWEGHGAPNENRGVGYHKTKTPGQEVCRANNGCVPELCQEDEIMNIMVPEIRLLKQQR